MAHGFAEVRYFVQYYIRRQRSRCYRPVLVGKDDDGCPKPMVYDDGGVPIGEAFDDAGASETSSVEERALDDRPDGDGSKEKRPAHGTYERREDD